MARKGAVQVNGFSGRTIGAMIQKSTGAGAASGGGRAAGPGKKTKKK